MNQIFNFSLEKRTYSEPFVYQKAIKNMLKNTIYLNLALKGELLAYI